MIGVNAADWRKREAKVPLNERMRRCGGHERQKSASDWSECGGLT
ncbi:hypothetical protein [Paenibacillus odorifer]|nr:hypothetical protein [Paenibacillus odorifer]